MNAGKTRRRAVVHGTARRVVIVSQDSTGPFEQAIFVVRGSSSLSEDELLEQAAAAAMGEVEGIPVAEHGPRRRVWIWTAAILCAAALIAAALAILL